MNWTTAKHLRAQVLRLWDRGELLAGLVNGEAKFPKRLILKCPTSAEMILHFDAVRNWARDLRNESRCRIELREFKHRELGVNTLPSAAWIDCIEDAAALIGRQREVTRFKQLIDVTRARQPLLLTWLAKRPLSALELADHWQPLLDIVDWIQAHPRPAVYLRQVDIARVHSKFIEAHRGTLAEWLDLVLSPSVIDASASGTSQFARRYGFRDKPVRIRFRILDQQHALLGADGIADITLDADSFARLAIAVTQVFITENEINFLAFPPMKDSLVAFGAGYGFEMLTEAKWLAHCRVFYWGDIDTHGFAILDQLRVLVGHTESLLMDRATLLAFESQWTTEASPTQRELPRLNDAESALYDDLRDNRIGQHLRLEQERIGFAWVEAALREKQSS